MRPGLRTTPREFECAIAVVAMTCTPAMMCLTLRRLLSLQGAGPVPTLQELLHDSVGVHFLVKFCASARRCDELIAWIEFEMFRVCEGTLLRRHQAKRLAAAYMGEQSAERIGISAPLAAAARAKVAAPSSGLTSLSFEDVQGAIEARMQTELLPRFLTSSYYRAFAANGGLGSDLGKVIGVGDFDFLRYLGAGGYGVAVLGRRKSNRRLVAIKAVDKRALIDRGKVHACFREKAALAHVNHPYILSLKYTLETEHYALFVTDYEFSGNMFADIKKGGPYPVERARLYTAQVVLAVAHLHEGGMLHRDIKPDNVLLTSDGHARLADMGAVRSVFEGGDLGNERLGSWHRLKTFDGEHIKDSRRRESAYAAAAAAASASEEEGSSMSSVTSSRSSRMRANRLTSTSGTHGYLAPEVYSEKYSEGADWWNLGLLVLEMLTGKNPLRGKDSGQSEFLAKNGSVPIPKGSDKPTAELLKGLLKRDTNQRLGCGGNGFRDVMAHPFFKGIDWDELMDMDNNTHKYPKYTPEGKDKDFQQLQKEAPAAGTNSLEHYCDKVKHLRIAKAVREERPITADEQTQFEGFAYESLEALREDLILARGAPNNRPTAYGTPNFVKYNFLNAGRK